MHTKGPWKVYASTDSWGWENYAINNGGIHSDDERQANARLIAAAPELLEALENLLRCSEYKATDYCGTCVPAASEAIRKAKGQ